MENQIALTKTQIDRLKHTIGWNYDNQPRKYGRSKPILNAYRNHYYGKDTVCDELCALGVMNNRPTNSPECKEIYYYVTPYGYSVIEDFFDIKIKRED